MKPKLLNLTHDELRAAVTAASQPAYRCDQLADWVYNKGVADPAAMSNLPNAFVEQFEILDSRVVAHADSRDGTIKLLLELHDGETIETVLIPTERFATACVSTQVGCAMGCAFCATGIDSLRRNLAADEILQQVLHLHQAGGQPITHVVFMGMGEPLANYNATLEAVRALIDPKRFNISARRVTVSTVGLPSAIRRLADEKLPITLAISLHAPNDALRQQIIPAAAKYKLEDILSAAEVFYQSRHREITLEYVLLASVNDTNVCAESLATIANRLRCSVNLMRYNAVASLPYVSPTSADVEMFAKRLKRRGVNVQIRRSRGADIAGACGQLRQNTIENK